MLFTESASDKLQEAEVPIIDGTTCSKYLGDLFYPSIMICAGFHDGGVDSCNVSIGTGDGKMVKSRGLGWGLRKHWDIWL